MGADTLIEWTATPLPNGTTLSGFTFNAWEGCHKVSPGCKNCYASERDKRWHDAKHWGATAPRLLHTDAYWRLPYKWHRDAQASGIRRKVFCSSLADVFEDRRDLDVHRARLYRMIQETPWLDWLLLSKRVEHAERLWLQAQIEAFNGADSLGPTWGHNVWLGATCENQEYADLRIPQLLAVPAAMRFLSCEPLLEEIDIVRHLKPTLVTNNGERLQHPDPRVPDEGGTWEGSGIGWLIVGGESGPGARGFDLRWARSLIDQCKQGNVPCFVKQMGTKPYETFADQKRPPIDRPCSHHKGGDPSEWVNDLRVRQFPVVKATKGGA